MWFPIVCSKDTGGPDLKNLLKDKKWIIEMEEFSIFSLQTALSKALVLAQTQVGLRTSTKNIIDSLTWEAYGKRYDNNLKRIIIF